MRVILPLQMKCNFLLVPSTAPSYIRLSNLHLAEVKVQWNPLSQYYANGRLLGYRVYFREYRSYYYYYSYLTSSVNTSSANGTMVILRDLKQATTYQIAVAAFTSKGEGPRSYWMSITTGNKQTSSYRSRSIKRSTTKVPEIISLNSSDLY